jgi:hypothetical protein
MKKLNKLYLCRCSTWTKDLITSKGHDGLLGRVCFGCDTSFRSYKWYEYAIRWWYLIKGEDSTYTRWGN